jgi:excisionase family DNA binding protein
MSIDLLTDEEVAERLALSTATLAKWRVTGRRDLPFVKIGAAVRYPSDGVDAFIASLPRRTTTATSPVVVDELTPIAAL